MDQDEIEMLRLLKAELESKKGLFPPPETHLEVMRGLHGHLKKIADAFGVNGACYDDMVKKIVAKAPKKGMVRVWAVRRAFADYLASEGCNCCEDKEEHDAARKRLANMLDVPMFDDKSGYDFHKFRTNKE